MTLLLHTTRDLPQPGAYATWFATTGTDVNLDRGRRVSGMAEKLESAFDACRDTWWRMGREMGGTKTAEIARTPTASAYGSDFGIMLAWSRLAGEAARGIDPCLAVCDDPWLFRHLARLPGVNPGATPPLWKRALGLRLRGILVRLKVALCMAAAALRLKSTAAAHAPGDYVILVYGHPDSDADGHDAYFDDLMRRLPGVKRLLHTDCAPGRATQLAADGRTASLHAWGSPLRALALVGEVWRLSGAQREGEFGWLVRRAAALENGGGGPAMTRWQMHCQERWLAAVRPARVSWPWENHAWERGLSRSARRLGIPTMGYQHAVIGPHQTNFSPATNPDGLDSIPDTIAANGPAFRAELLSWCIPAERLVLGGAFRFKPLDVDLYDPDAPVFVPLSAIPEVAHQQMAAAVAIGRAGRRVLVKEHPMYPMNFKDFVGLDRTETPLPQQPALSAVLYTTGASGLEGLLAGLPTFRLMPDDRIAIDTLPAAAKARAVSMDTLDEILEPPRERRRLVWETIFSAPQMDLWRRHLSAQPDSPANGESRG